MSSSSPQFSLAKIYSLGYGNRTPEQLFDLVRAKGCQYLIDVRSIPYSKYHRQYNRESLEQLCTEYGLKYLYLGDQLGGKPEKGELDEFGRADYEKMTQRPGFQEGIDRLKKAKSQGYSVALMCAELRPETCHRTRLIGTALSKRGLEVQHIDENANQITQSEALGRFNNGQDDLFN